jgi:hypothetical protein
MLCIAVEKMKITILKHNATEKFARFLDGKFQGIKSV